MRLYLNALGLVCPLGSGKAAVAERLFSGSRAGLTEQDGLLPGRTIRVGCVTGPLPEVPCHLSRVDCRNNRLALAALGEIEPAVLRAVERYGSGRVGVVMGTSTSGMAEAEEAVAVRQARGTWPDSYRYTQQELGNLAACLADRIGVTGPAYTISTACSSSAKALASAARLVRLGLSDAVVVGGADALCRLTVNGFASLEAVAADYCNPFSRNRDGINIGEGAAVFLLSREPSPVALLGVGETADAHHASAPDPSGAGAWRAMSLALRSASVDSDSIDYINLHGTATMLNDLMEGRAVQHLFGRNVPCSSTKGMTGHLLGAAGAVEAAFLWLVLDPEFSTGALPPHLWDGASDPEIPPLNLVSNATRAALGTRSAMLSNSFAFGGSNAAVVLGRGW